MSVNAIPDKLAAAVRGRLPSRDVTRPVDTDALLEDPEFRQALSRLAGELGREPDAVADAAAGCLKEMSATLDPAANASWQRLGDSLLRAYDIVADEAALARLRALDRKHSLVWLASHRSYLDLWAMPRVLREQGLSHAYGFGGANLNFFPFGQIARRTGVIFVRRTVKDDPVYRLALRSYVSRLVRDRVNLMWSIEGGRTRTGKLRPPRYGLLRYLMDAAAATDGPEILLVPVSFVYDQLHEVSSMTTEARGLAKRPEDIRWFLHLLRQQGHRLGHIYLDIGEPVPLRERMESLQGGPEEAHAVERIALDICHRINSVTPVTPTAVVTLALLAADRALTFDEVVETIEPTARYLRNRNGRVAGGVSLTDRSGVRRTLRELTESGVLTMFDGDEPVWSIAPGQHLVAAFYRNTAVHLLVNRAIGEIALLAATEDPAADASAASHAALDLRELLKFDFFFAGRDEFGKNMRAELSLIDPGWEAESGADRGPEKARHWLELARPHVAHLVLRPFLDAYLVVAERLAVREPEQAFDEQRFLEECLRMGRQWVLQRKLASEESLSLELFRPAVRLARHRDLLGPDGADLAERRNAFADEVHTACRRVAVIADIARSNGSAE